MFEEGAERGNEEGRDKEAPCHCVGCVLKSQGSSMAGSAPPPLSSEEADISPKQLKDGFAVIVFSNRRICR